MTNEELLQAVSEMIGALDTKIKNQMDGLDTKIKNQMDELDTKIKNQMDELDTKLTIEIHNKTEGLKAYIENGVARDVKLLAEGYMSLSEKVDGIKSETDKIPDLCDKADLIEAVVTEHSKRLNKLA